MTARFCISLTISYAYFSCYSFGAWLTTQIRLSRWKISISFCQDWKEQEGDWRGQLAAGAEDWLVSNTVYNKPNMITLDDFCVRKSFWLCPNMLLNNYVQKRRTNKEERIGKSGVQACFLFWWFLKQTFAASVSCQHKYQTSQRTVLDAIFGIIAENVVLMYIKIT